MRTYAFGKCFSKLFSFLSKCITLYSPRKRYFAQEKILNYDLGTPNYNCLKEALKKTSTNITHIPICIGEDLLGSCDVQYQCMPHNIRCKISELSKGNSKLLKKCDHVVGEMRKEWIAVPIKERIEICKKCADILASERRHALNASIMLGQSKTYRQAEEDTCRTINCLRNYSELLSNLETECISPSDKGYTMQARGGFVAALTPYNWMSQAVNLVLCPALMGNCVLWVPSLQAALSSFEVFRAFEKAGIPRGVINFIPMNLRLFLKEAQNLPHLVGLNYAGRSREYEELADAVSRFVDRPKSFRRLPGPIENNNYHFVHESANIECVTAETVRAAFTFNGQRGNSCENLYVPCSMWPALQDSLLSEVGKLRVGDIFDIKTTNSAVIDHTAYKRQVKLLNHAEQSEDCCILCGGNYKHTHGYFIEPTVVVCKTPHEKLMNKPFEGPILSVFVYENNKMEEILQHIVSSASYPLTGAVFSEDDSEACNIMTLLRTVTANLYLNKGCVGDMDGQCNGKSVGQHKINAGQYSLLEHW